MHSLSGKHRYGVVGLMVLLFAITYLDRICISVAGPRIQDDLHIGPAGWGWVTGMFTLSYCLFEIPTGVLADRIGPRRVLTRVVLWWSAFTALTGAMTGFVPLLATRFLFGAGEAGAFPASVVVVSRWFPPEKRATMSGVTLMASQIGGAIAPLLVVPIQSRYGWRASFFTFGVIGAGWAAVWYAWFRDSPAEKSGAKPLKPAKAAASHAQAFPWRAAFKSPTALAMMGTGFSYVYVYNFFQTWFHTFLVKGRGFTEEGLWFSALPYVLAICTNLAGGAVSDAMVRRLGSKDGRRFLGAASLAGAGLLTIAVIFTRQQTLTVVLLALVYGAITFQQSGAFGVCLDVGQKHAGAMMGLMNMTAQVGGLLGSVAYGYIVAHFGSYDAPFIPMAALLFAGALFWLRIDASKALSGEPRLDLVPAA